MLTKEEVLQLLHSKESSRVERTVSTTDMDKFQEAICAFANDLPNSHQNGYLLIGVTDNGDFSGLKVDDDLLKKISSIRSNGNILPLPMMTVESYTFEEGDLLVVEVQPSFSTPVRYRGRTFVRIGPRRDIASEDEERVLSEKREASLATFDTCPCFNATLDDLYADKIIEEYIPKAVDPEVLSVDRRTPEQQMAALGLYDIRNNCPTYAGLMLYGKRPKQFMFGSYIQYGRFAGKSTGNKIVEERAFYDGLAVALPKLDNFLEYGVVKTKPVFVSFLREEQVKNYPKDALRELLLNACMHRDLQSNMPTRFYSFNDRIEIMNPGGLYGKARPENFPLINDYRNPIVAGGLKVLGYVNLFNHGITQVKELLKENGNPEPIFKYDDINVFAATVPIAGPEDFYYDNVSVPNKEQSEQKEQKEQKEQSEQRGQTIEERIIELIKKNPKITQAKMAKALNLNYRSYLTRIIDTLKKENVLDRVGSKYQGHWIINEIRVDKGGQRWTKEQKEQTVEDKIIQLIKENPKITQKDMAKALNFKSRSYLTRIINNLKKEGIIERKGSDFNGQWIVLDVIIGKQTDYRQGGQRWTEVDKERTNEQKEPTIEDKIIQLIKENPKITQKDMVKALNFKSRSYLARIINKLKKEGRIERTGCNFNGQWLVLHKS